MTEPGHAAGGPTTRDLLIDAACRAFAEHGVHSASLLEITRQAGQRNRGAVHYHFGGREGLLAAVLEQQADFLAEREARMLRRAEERPADDVASVVEAVVRPVTELSETGWRGRCYLVILGDLVEQDPASMGPDVESALARTGGHQVYDLLAERMAPLGLDHDVAIERQALLTHFVLRAVADRARAEELPARRRRQLPTELFICNLIAMGTAMITAPAPSPPAAG